MYEIDPAPPSISDVCRDRSEDLGAGVIEMALPGGTSHEEAAQTIQPKQMLPHVLKGMNLFSVVSRADFVRELTHRLPLNEYNLPIYFYRPDMLNQSLIHTDTLEGMQQLQAMLESSMVYINYHQGFPTLTQDRPFWQKLEFETQDAFVAFVQYLDLKGARTTDRIQNVPPEVVSEWYHLNYWSYRAKAFDMFTAAHHERMKYHRIYELEDKHFEKAEKILGKVYAALDGKSLEELSHVEPEKLVAMMEKLIKIQRAAAGLATDSGKNTSPPNTSVEVLIKRNAEKEAPTKIETEEEIDQGALLEDPATLEMAQDLILKITSTGGGV